MGDPPPPPVLLQPGKIIQDFEIMKPLGKGKFSVVYMAKRLSDGLVCALKKINIFDMMVPKQREKCLKEVRLLKSLDHPHIVKLLSSFIDNNELLIIVEWAERGDLKRLLRKAQSNSTRFKEEDIWEYSRQLAGALDHMHTKRIMHRDLKPANIFVCQDGSLKLGDLGLGRFFSSQTLEAFSKVGTPLYMSPEVLHGAGYDMRSDVWSLGCVLYEMVMLRSPFKSDQQLSLYDLFVRISKGQYPPLPEERISADFRCLVDRMLQLEPTKRPDCAQVLEVCTAQKAAFAQASDSSKAHSHAASSQAVPSRASSRPSPLLVMDDVVEKLKLLECEELLLRKKSFPILHRCFFTQQLPLPGQLSQFEVMYELFHWLLGMLKARDDREAAAKTQEQAAAQQSESGADASAGPSLAAAAVGAGDAAAGGGALPALLVPHTTSDSAAVAQERGQIVQNLAAHLRLRGIQVSSEATLAQLRQGYGEGVCLILNELINQELMARDFHFVPPDWQAQRQEEPLVPEVEEDCEVDTGSQSNHEDAESCSNASAISADGGLPVYTPETPAASSSSGGRAFFEPIHVCNVNRQEWERELERVKPMLRNPVQLPPGTASGWRYTFRRARELCAEIEEARRSQTLRASAKAARRHWREQLERIKGHEDRLNTAFGSATTHLAGLRDSIRTETERVTDLNMRVSELSERLASLTRAMDTAQDETARQHEVLHDPEQIMGLRRALRRLRQEDRQLAVRVQIVQGDLLRRKFSG